MDISNAEESCAKVAVEVVASAGGYVTFEQYDALIASKSFWAPFSWCAGWGSRRLLRSNQEKLCAAAAVKLGLLTHEDAGYRVVS
jgi:hypothetical protein